MLKKILPAALALLTLAVAFELHARSLESAPMDREAPSPIVAPIPAAASDCAEPEPVKPVSFGTCS
jgi:hypothetical protein